LFGSTVEEHRIESKREHYGCRVNILGRIKLLQEAAVWEYSVSHLLDKENFELDPNHDGATSASIKHTVHSKPGNYSDAQKVRE
jgi:hypothetical protein